MREIVIFAPTKSTYEKSISIINDNNYDNVDVIFANLNESIPIAQDSIKRGARVIISRGGTYKILKENYDIPIVEIKVDAYDIIESYKEANTINEPIGIVGFNNVIDGFDVLEEILNNKITKIEVEKEEDMYNIVERYSKEGITTYIGDTTVTKMVEKLNCKGILIESGREKILSAIQAANEILRGIKVEKERRLQIEAMTDFVHDGIITVDKDYNITLFNKSAEKIFGVRQEDVILKNIRAVIPNTFIPKIAETKQPKIGMIENIKNHKIIANGVPIVVDDKIQGVVSTFQDSREISLFEHKIRRSLLNNGFYAKYTFDNIIHKSQQMKDCIEEAKKYAGYDTPITIIGESGVGKELLCQSIHNYSQRSNSPFVAVNCAAIPPSLIESEFFGYEDGAFTGARKKGKMGVFELAHNGTIFLDEISEIPLELQGRLLRVLQEKQIIRIGGDKVIPIDVKIICASNKDLEVMVEDATFRTDLYFRINILNLYIPSLRERKEDIGLLAKFFVDKYSRKYNKKPLSITYEINNILSERHYKGNVRELEGIIERCVIIGNFDSLFNDRKNKLNCNYKEDIHINEFTLDGLDLKTIEKKYIQKVYKETNYNTNKTCEILKITRATLWRRLKEIKEDV